MKKKILLFALLTAWAVSNYAQPVMLFQGHENNPVLEPGPGDWDMGGAFTPSVVYANGTFYMFYSGSEDVFYDPISIGYATSADGVTFEKVTLDEPLFGPDGTGFDAWSVSDEIIAFDGTEWVMFYGGVESSGQLLAKAIGRATAPAPEGPWVRLDDPVLAVGGPDEWDSYFVFPVSIITIGSVQHLYYWAGNDYPYGTWYIGLATSTDGFTWTKHDDPLTTSAPFAESDPILKSGATGEWDDGDLVGCSVWETATGYEMFYSGTSQTVPGCSIGYATSEDGVEWEKSNLVNPLYTWYMDPYAYANNFGVLELPSVIVVGSTYYMYYDYGPYPRGIGLATADALIQTIHVPGDKSGIQSAINVATDGDTVLVDAGTYYENINFRGKAITVASNYMVSNDPADIENTVIDGSQPDDPFMASTVMFSSMEGNGSVLNGFTITGGTGYYVPPGGGFPAFRAGGGIGIFMSGPTIRNNHIINNSVIIEDGMSDGGGISCGPPGNPYSLVLEGNVIANNYSSSGMNPGAAGVSVFSNAAINGNEITGNLCESDLSQGGPGGLGCFYGQVTVENNTIAHNAVYVHDNTPTKLGGIGGGAVFFMSSGTVTGNTIEHNRVSAADGDTCFAAGVLVELCTPDMVIDANTIANNGFDGSFCYGGGLAIWYGGATVHNNMIYGDSATFGAGICMYDTSQIVGEVEILNNTIAHNYAASGGKGLFSHRTNATVRNTIFWDPDNAVVDEIVQEGGELSVTYSVVNGSFGSEEGNFYEDPQFSDPQSADYHIEEDSPCAAAGTDEAFPPFDFEGDQRPLPAGNMPDIGADEVDEGVGVFDRYEMKTNLVKVYPNPASASATIEYIVPENGCVSLAVLDAEGRVIRTEATRYRNKGVYELTLNTKAMKPGVYFLQLRSNNVFSCEKLIVFR